MYWLFPRAKKQWGIKWGPGPALLEDMSPTSLLTMDTSNLRARRRVKQVSRSTQHKRCGCSYHRYRIDKYLDTLLANQTTRKASPPIIPKVAIARWRTARVIFSLILPDQSQRSRSSTIANGVSSAVRRIAKCGMQNTQPS